MVHKIFKFIASASIATMALANAMPAMAQNVVVNKFPKSYTYNGRAFNNLEGYVINIQDYRQLTLSTPDMINEQVRCDAIHPTTKSIYLEFVRENCLNFRSTIYGCADVYGDTIYQPEPADYNRMVPNQPVQVLGTKTKTGVTNEKLRWF